MSHEIDTTTGEAACMVNGTPAWHRLGQVVDGAPTSEEAIRIAKLNWRVEEWPLEGIDAENGDRIAVPNHKALVREDTRKVLSVQTNQYRPLQNADAFRFMDQLVQEGDVKYETAGALKGGRVVWMLAKLPTTIRVDDDRDVQYPYVLLSNSHDGTQAIRIAPTMVRVVCNNTMNLAQRENVRKLTIPHMGDVDRKIDDARKMLGLVEDQLHEYSEQAKAMAKKQITNRQLADFLNSVVPTPHDATDRIKRKRKQQREQIKQLMDHPANALPTIRGSVWAAFQAATQWTDWHQPSAGQTDDDRASNKFNDIFWGKGAGRKAHAFEKALQLSQ